MVKSSEIKEKLSKARKGKKKVFKNITPEEVYKKISNSNKGKKRTDEQKDQISSTLKEYYKTEDGLLARQKISERQKNIKLSDEHKSNIKKSMKGKKPKKLDVHPSARYWFFYDKNNNLILKTLGNRTKALKELNTNQRRILIFNNLDECLKCNITNKNIDYKLFYIKYYNKQTL